MRKAYMVHHLGLGDHIICNGLIREICKNIDLLYFPVKFHNFKNIARMFVDMQEKIKFVPIADDFHMMLSTKSFAHIQKIAIGIHKNSADLQKTEFAKVFYNHANVDYSLRWDSFYVDYSHNQPVEDYKNEKIFIHDDRSRKLVIDESRTSSALAYRPSHSLGKPTHHTIFDYIEVLKAVDEIHCMDSSFACLIDHCSFLYDKKKYIHRYLRKDNHNPYYKNNWEIIYE
jgi:hypothetical protein